MSYTLSVYGEKAFKKILLPAINNADYRVILSMDLFGLDKDLILSMEIVKNQWNFKKDSAYALQQNGRDYFGRSIRDRDILQLHTVSGYKLTILIHELDTPFEVYKKYSLKNIQTVTIGKGGQNHICYDYFGLVSKEHAALEIRKDGCVIHDFSANGVFVNGFRVRGQQILKFGDSVHILGLQIIYLGDLLAIEQETASMVIDRLALRELSAEKLQYFAAKDSDAAKKGYFHRTPRNIEKIDRDPIEIEEPPAPARPRNQSWILAVGPAFSMAIPMLLGSVMSIYGAASSSLMMYSGLVTAISSAFIGSIWAGLNVRTAKKEAAAEEKQRKEAYAEYLEKTRMSVKEKYERNTRILHAKYPAAETCAKYGRHTAALWNRNMHHEDFLYHRLGLGRVPFQAPITIPKDRFRIIKDDMATKPKDILVAYEILKDIPVGVDFMEHTLTGIIGGEKKAGALDIVRNLLVQIAAGNCYTEVKLGIIYNCENSYEAECLREARFLPHVWSEDKKTRYVADTPSEADEVFYELSRIFRNREEEEHSFGKEVIPKPWYILIITDPSYLEREALAKYVYAGNRQLGLSTILLAESYEELPNSCEFIIQNDREFEGFYQVTDDISDRVPIRFDHLSKEAFGQFARRLSGIEIRETEKGGELPSTLTFFEMLGIHSLKELDILTGWRKNRTYESMKAQVGQKAGGVPCYLDIHEKYHGPHGLVAGTTGSGKSETLQTYILSLAINYSPDDVGFFVIDYKGGGMANLFSNLPHTIGQISNLSGNQVHRAMVSIKSENRRRQKIFNEHGVNNINNYTRLYKNNEASVPVPHLFIIIDEFAELKREEPDFMRELISVAQVGRSLGVHLILATQKPSGTVDDNIWSNAKFRLCLRVQDRQDSNDMLHKPDAAYITQAGRCYLQVGNDEIYELFQSGWSGAVYDEMEGSTSSEIAYMYSMSGKAALVGNRLKIRQKEKQKYTWITEILTIFEKISAEMGCSMENVSEDVEIENTFMEKVFAAMAAQEMDFPENEYNRHRLEDLLWLYRKVTESQPVNRGRLTEKILNQAILSGKKLPEVKEKTQLDAVVEYLAVLARENGYNNPFMLWMPVLPEKLLLDELKGYGQRCFDGITWPKQEENWKLEAYVGLIDDPVNQAQMPLLVSISEGGNHAVCGTVVSGKSTFLQTFVYSMAHSYSPDYVNFYLLDFSSHMLGAFEKMPHVGGVIYENDVEKVGKFFHMIGEIMAERKTLLQGGNYAQYVQAHGVVLPAIVIVIDQFSNFREKTGGIYEDDLIQISRNGNGYGIYLMISSAGFGMTEIPHRIGDNMRTVLSLEMSDKYQYADVLHTLRISVYPENGVKGRGLILQSGEVLEFQTALCVDADDDYMRTENIEKECVRMSGCWQGRRARRIPEIPEKPVLEEFMALEEVEKHFGSDCWLPLGYNQENASIYSLDLSRIFCWIVQGKARSGKTNVLKILMAMAQKKGGELAVVDFDGALKNNASRQNARYLQTEQEIVAYWWDLLPVIQQRNAIKKEAIAEELDTQEIYAKMSSEKAIFIFIDDLVEFVKKVYNPEEENNMQAFLENITEKGSMFRIYILAGLNYEKASEVAGYGVFENIVRQKSGIHLGGNVIAQQYLNFEPIPFTEQGKIYKPGIGLLSAQDGETEVKEVVLPLDRRKK